MNKHIFYVKKQKVTDSTVPYQYINNSSRAITHEGFMVSFNRNAFIFRAVSVSVLKLTDRKKCIYSPSSFNRKGVFERFRPAI